MILSPEEWLWLKTRSLEMDCLICVWRHDMGASPGLGHPLSRSSFE